jgi:hypothetical protein
MNGQRANFESDRIHVPAKLPQRDGVTRALAIAVKEPFIRVEIDY